MSDSLTDVATILKPVKALILTHQIDWFYKSITRQKLTILRTSNVPGLQLVAQSVSLLLVVDDSGGDKGVKY